jgi:hypothetical protein
MIKGSDEHRVQLAILPAEGSEEHEQSVSKQKQASGSCYCNYRFGNGPTLFFHIARLLISRAALTVPFHPYDHEHGQQLGGFSLARILINSVSITGHPGEVLPGAISNDGPIIGFVLNFASSCLGFYLAGTSTGAPLFFTKNTTNFAGLVWLAFRPTT